MARLLMYFSQFCWLQLLVTARTEVTGHQHPQISITTSSTTSMPTPLNWTRDCPCRLCHIDSAGQRTIVCDDGGRTVIPIDHIVPSIQIIEITAPEKNPNNLTLGPLFYRFPEMRILSVRHSNVPAIGHSTFLYRSKLLHLDLSHNRIRQLFDTNFRGLSKLVTLDLGHNLLNDLASGTFQYLINLRKLNLAYNEISTITTRLFYNLTQIESLDLSHNPIGDITAQNAVDLRSLAQLYLVDCQLGQLHSLFYYNLPNLRILDLRDNRIESIHSNEFRYLKNLTELYLNGNRLTSIAPNAFYGNQLAKLNLAQNELTEFGAEVFSNATIFELDISDNNFTYFESETFQPLASGLKILKANRIGWLENPAGSTAAMLAPLKQLWHVELSGINLDSSKLNPDLFASHRHTLRHLNLSHNSLVNISARLMDDLDSVELIDLSHNTLYELSSDFLYSLSHYSNLSLLFLDHNPWSCYRCHLLYFRNWITTVPNPFDNACQQYNRCAECQYPQNLQGLRVHELEEWQLEWCTDPTVQLRVSTTEPNVGLVLALLIIIILIIVIIGVIVYYRNRGAIYFTNEDLLYARSSTMEDKSSVYNISNAIRYFADATASPPESPPLSSIESDHHHHSHHHHPASHNYAKVNGRSHVASSQSQPRLSHHHVEHVTMPAPATTKPADSRKQHKSSASSGKSWTNQKSFDEQPTVSESGTSRYRVLKQQSSNVSSEESHREMEVKGKEEEEEEVHSPISLDSYSSESGSESTNVSAKTTEDEEEEEEEGSHRDSLPSTLKPSKDPIVPEISVPDDDLDTVKIEVISKSSLDSLTAALAEGDSNSTSAASSARSLDYGSKSPDAD